MSEPAKESQTYTKWDHYFAQWCFHWLPTLGLTVQKKPSFSQLPLEADILVIATQPNGEWTQHPVWRCLSPYTVVEFKSVSDDFKAVDFGKLMAYVGLTMEKEALPPEVEIGGWLIMPYINRQLRHVLSVKKIELQTLSVGIHRAHTDLFPLLVVEYNKLPNEPVYAELKTFMKKGTDLRWAMEVVLRKWKGSKLYREYTTIITAIHKQEAKSVIELLEEDKQNFLDFIELSLETLGPEADRLPFIQKELKDKEKEAKLLIARQMKADNIPVENIAKYTGLSPEDIEAL